MENKKVLIIHGLNGSEYPHWQSNLAIDLIKDNYIVSFPSFPVKHNPKLEEWKIFLRKELEHFNPNIVICHSLGGIIWFHACSEIDFKADKLLIVAPPRNSIIEVAKTFFPYPTPKDLKAKEAYMIVSTNDEYLNIQEAKELQNKLNIKMHILENAGHINANSGFGRCDFALSWIKTQKENN